MLFPKQRSFKPSTSRVKKTIGHSEKDVPIFLDRTMAVMLQSHKFLLALTALPLLSVQPAIGFLRTHVQLLPIV
jgi:hypothetical protein